MANNNQQLLLYFKLLGKSYLRLFREFPLVLQLLFAVLFGTGVYLLASFPFVASGRNYGIVFVVFFLLGQWFCRMSSSERVLLGFLKIPVFRIRVVKCLLLSVFFFLLDVGVGLFAAVPATLAVASYSGGAIRNIRIPSLYVPASYQWQGMYRRLGIWVLLSGFALLLIGLWHGNRNMVCFCLGWILCLPCLLAYYGQPDPKQFMSVYKHSGLLVRKKLGELLVNTSVPAVACMAFLLAIDFTHSGFYLKFILLFIYVDLLMFYFFYVCYPHLLTACVLFAITAYISVGLFLSYPYIAGLSALLLPALLHILAVINLKTIISYGKVESAD